MSVDQKHASSGIRGIWIGSLMGALMWAAAVVVIAIW